MSKMNVALSNRTTFNKAQLMTLVDELKKRLAAANFRKALDAGLTAV
jgi:hypothetical protein